MNTVLQQGPPDFDLWQRSALVTGVGALTLCAIGLVLNPTQFLRSYLVAYLFWTGIALGCLAILMIQYLTGGAWGIIARRPLESATSTLPLLAFFFLPLLLGMHHLYGWTHADLVAADPYIQHKRLYLNTPFFMVRWALCFILWSGTAYLLNRWSSIQDRTADPDMAVKLQNLSGPGLFALAVTLTFSLIDWVMSLEPDWYSTIYGVGFIAGETLAAFAFIISVLTLISNHPPLSEIVRPKHFRDLGNLLLTFVMLWAYCSFSQLLIIWSGNLREEIPWYLRRLQNGWGWIGALLIVFHFFVPFFLLLSVDIKHRRQTLALVAGLILFMHFIDLYWVITPAFYPNQGEILGHLLLTVLALVGLGGIWLWMFLRRLRSSSMLPLNDPNMQEVFGHENI